MAEHRATGDLEYKYYSNFGHDYKDILDLGDNLRWSSISNLITWLEALMNLMFLVFYFLQNANISNN